MFRPGFGFDRVCFRARLAATLRTSVAQAPELDRQALPAQGAWSAGPRPDAHYGLREASDHAAAAADEMGVLLVPMAWAARNQLEAPNVIPHVGAPHQADLGQIQQIAVDGGPVEAAPDQAIGELAMTQRATSLDQLAEHFDSRERGSQAGAAEHVAQLIGVHRLHLPHIYAYRARRATLPSQKADFAARGCLERPLGGASLSS